MRQDERGQALTVLNIASIGAEAALVEIVMQGNKGRGVVWLSLNDVEGGRLVSEILSVIETHAGNV